MHQAWVPHDLLLHHHSKRRFSYRSELAGVVSSWIFARMCLISNAETGRSLARPKPAKQRPRIATDLQTVPEASSIYPCNQHHRGKDRGVVAGDGHHLGAVNSLRRALFRLRDQQCNARVSGSVWAFFAVFFLKLPQISCKPLLLVSL